ncbi:MAG: hypothetical protein ACM3YE_03350, partial [Bacteroidota bacterium]
MKKIPIMMMAMIVACMAACPVYGATVLLNSRAGFGGYLVPGTAMPVVVEINRPIAAGRLEIINSDQAGTFSIINSFPVQNWKRVEASVFINEGSNAIKVRLFSGEKLLVETGLNPEMKLFPGNLVLAINMPASAQQAIERALLPAESVLVAPVDIADLPGTPLNYDGVNGLVLSDPGPVFTPVQVQALKAWLAGGGRIVLGRVRPGQDSLLTALGIRTANKEQSFYPIGFGGVTALQDELALTASQWRNLLNLKPYPEITRLTVNRIFPEYQSALSSKSPTRSSKAALYLTLVLISWVISGLLITIPAKGGRILMLVCFTLLWTGAAFPVGNWLAGTWHRGAEIQSRTILLPEGGMLTDVKLKFTPFKILQSINLQASPWGGRVSLGSGNNGKIKLRDPARAFTWFHGSNQSQTLVQKADLGFANLTGWFPNTSLNHEDLNWMELYQSLGPNGEELIWNGRNCYRAADVLLRGDWEPM